MEEKKYDLIKFSDGEFSLDVNVSPSEDTVWLTKEQISQLFCRDRSVISKHIKNILLEKECEEKSNVQKMHIANSDKPVDFYSLDIILSVGYRVKSTRGNIFRRWANFAHTASDGKIYDEIVYMIGKSFNEIGKKRFVIIKTSNLTKDKILR